MKCFPQLILLLLWLAVELVPTTGGHTYGHQLLGWRRIEGTLLVIIEDLASLWSAENFKNTTLALVS